jgi:MFS family permease
MRSSPARTIRLYCGFQIFFNLLLWLPIFYEYQKAMGLSDAQIFGIQSVYYLSFCLLEVPTGFLADRWGHRRVLCTAAAVLVFANLLPIYAANYAGFLLHFLLIAVSRSLESGASSAYLYEFLKSQGRAGEYKHVEGRARAYELSGKLLGWAVIGLIMQWHVAAPYGLTVAFALASFFLAAALPAPQSPASAEPAITDWHALAENTSSVFRSLARSRWLVLLMAQGFGVFALGHLLQVELYQPLLRSKSFDIGSYGWLMSVMTLAEAAGSANPHWLRKAMTDFQSSFALTVLMAVILAWIAVTAKAGTILGMLIFAYAIGLAYPVQKQLLNDAITDSRHRATLLSIESIFDRTVYAALLPAMAFFVSTGRVGQFLLFASVAVIAGMGALYMVMRAASTAVRSEPA